MCEMDELRKKTISKLGKSLTNTLKAIFDARDDPAGLKLKDLEVLDRLQPVVVDSMNYFLDELDTEKEDEQ